MTRAYKSTVTETFFPNHVSAHWTLSWTRDAYGILSWPRSEWQRSASGKQPQAHVCERKAALGMARKS